MECRNCALFNYSKALCLLLVRYNVGKASGSCLRAFITMSGSSGTKTRLLGSRGRRWPGLAEVNRKCLHLSTAKSCLEN